MIAENNANCAAVGEYYASENAGNIVFITLGTGIGGGIIIDGITIFNESEKGNLEASRIINEWIGEIGIGLTNMVNIFQPDEIIIGGAVRAQGDVIMEPVRKYVYENEYTAPDKNIKKVRIAASRLGGDAGIIGAALLWKNKTSK